MIKLIKNRSGFLKKFVKSLISAALVVSILGINAFALTPNYNVSSQYKASKYYTNLINVKLTGNQAQDIANVALSQEGYHEGNSNADLGGGSSGTGNYTEYGYWFGNQFNWCAVFVSWCARQAGIPESVIKKNSLASGLSCNFGEKKYNFGTRAPQVGDILYIDNDSDPEADHVALVYKVDSQYIYSIEGNCSQMVYALKYKVSDGSQTYKNTTKILFYGVPNYSTGNTNTAVKKGDVNLDSMVNSTDSLMILEYSVGKRTFNAEQKEAADFNSDGKINSIDSLSVLKKATGLI